MRLRSDKLPVLAYVRHGDMCSCAPFCKVLGCASRHDSSDYVLVARFSYLQEGIDYCKSGAARGVRMLLVSKITSEHLRWHYVPHTMQAGPSDRVVGKDGEVVILPPKLPPVPAVSPVFTTPTELYEGNT